VKGQWNRLAALFLRDAATIAITAGLWSYAMGLEAGAWRVAVSLATALATVFAGFLVHEWGHLLGAWYAGASFALPARVTESVFLFRFDNVRNSARQFCAMSLGGFISSLLAVAFLVAFLPSGTLATGVALGLTALGVFATFVIEVPEFWRVYRGGPLPQGAAYVSDGK
jgi:hypothetical protein